MARPQKSAVPLSDAQLTKYKMYGIDISFTLVTVLCVCLRFWARYRSEGSYGWDDWLVLVSMLIVWIKFAMNVVMIEHGPGLQGVDVPISSLIMFNKVSYGDEIIYVIALAVIKISILVMYYRVFPVRRFRITAWILGLLTVVWSLMFICICIFQCSPIPRAWNLTIPGTCLNLQAVFIGNAVPNIMTDAAILILPISYVWKLQLRRVQRLAITGIFLLGAFVIVVSIYRFTIILNMDQLSLSYNLKKPVTWSYVEVSVALICACLPTMKPLLTAFLKVIGVNRISQHGTPKEYGEGRGESNARKSHTKNNATSLGNFSVLDEGRDGWSTPATKASSNDELPLNKTQVHKKYEQEVETGRPQSDGWLDDRRRWSWYLGS